MLWCHTKHSDRDRDHDREVFFTKFIFFTCDVASVNKKSWRCWGRFEDLWRTLWWITWTWPRARPVLSPAVSMLCALGNSNWRCHVTQLFCSSWSHMPESTTFLLLKFLSSGGGEKNYAQLFALFNFEGNVSHLIFHKF